MGECGVGVFFLAHDEHRVSIGVGLRLENVFRGEQFFVEVESYDVVLVGKAFHEGLGRIVLNGDGDRASEILAQLFDEVVLEANDRTVVDKIVGGVAENECGYGVAVLLYLFLVLEFGYERSMCYPSVPKEERSQKERCHQQEQITIVFLFQDFRIGSSPFSSSGGNGSVEAGEPVAIGSPSAARVSPWFRFRRAGFGRNRYRECCRQCRSSCEWCHNR